MRRLASLVAASLFAAPAAQAAAPPPAPPAAYDAGPEAFQARLAPEGERNRVLNDMEIGARAFWRADYATAKTALDEAIGRIGAVFAGDPNAAKARKLWYDEGSKDFKGEPYERAMAFLYRGLIYLHDGDYENARAAFRQGQMQDAFAEEQQFRSDFALLIFLEAWASHLNGDEELRDQALQVLGKLRPEFPGIGKADDTLVLAETGFAPRKLGDGADHAYFVYRRGKNIAENQAEIVRPTGAARAFPMEDIFYQASTRGGRQIDRILQGKAELKQNTGSVGSFIADGSVVASYFVGANDGVAIAGGVAGVLLLVSSNAKPQADTRAWSSLPDTVHVLTFAAGGQPPPMSVRFLKDGAPVAGAERPIRCDTRERRSLCLVRAHPPLESEPK
jgi:tetratricopeptide (TPR) repeat protein